MMSRKGTSFIDLMISMAIIALLFGGIYLVYFSLVTSVGDVGIRNAAASVISQEIETIRNLPYGSVGTVGGIPPGVVPQTQSITSGSYTFSLATTILNIHDPYDTGPGATADYKFVSITATCPTCNSPISVAITTTVASNNLNSGTDQGSLFVYALDSYGDPIQGATVAVSNASVTPSIGLTDTTNDRGVLELVGAPTSTQGYSIVVTKPGYSTEMTYPLGAAGNPNPVKPNATVAEQTVTSITFSIDRLSSLTVTTANNVCGPVASEPFSFSGTKLIGTDPDILKFSTSSTTGADGTAAFSDIEWDTYDFVLSDASEDIAGTIPLDPVVINPSSTVNFSFILQSADNPSLLVTAVDSGSGAGVSNATVKISRSGFSATQTTGQDTIAQSDWSGGAYASQSGGIDAGGTPGALTLLANASGTYATSSAAWLISNTIDLGGSSSTLYSVSWNPAAQPAGTQVEFQIAANNDDATWNFVGPDGTAGSYYSASSSALSAFSGNRYLRYKVFLSTQDENAAPELDDISFVFSANCVPPAQTLFTGLATGDYTVDVAAQDYAENSTTVSVSSGEQSSTISLTHL